MINWLSAARAIRPLCRTGRRILFSLTMLMITVCVTAAVAPGIANAYPATDYYVSFGNTVTRGTVTWFSLSNTASGTLHSATGRKRVCLYVSNASKAAVTCGPVATAPQTISYTISIADSGPGGWGYAEVWLYDQDEQRYLTADYCYRNESCHTL